MNTKLFKELTLKDAETALNTELEKLVEGIPSNNVDVRNKFAGQMDAFQKLFQRYLRATSDSLDWKQLNPLPSYYMKMYSQLQPPETDELIKQQLDKLVIVKLNGGLGTTMGCTGPKSLISVRNDLTFLDLTIQQIEVLNNKYNSKVPLVLMNSFNTHADTEKVLQKYRQINVDIMTFLQSSYPRLNRESLLPMAKAPLETEDNRQHDSCVEKPEAQLWYPPGHGDFYRSFMESGLLKKFIDEGKEYVFLSNIDNLGATLDMNILNFLLTSSPTPDFVMEVTDKTKADVKGGTLTYYQGHLRLLELAQVPKEYIDEFSSVRKFRIFNTNNLWARLRSIEEAMVRQSLQMEVIVNLKTLATGTVVVQLEEAAGAAIKSFKNSFGINVPRDRFLPVKTTSDLLLVMSNLYELHNGQLTLSPARSFPSVPLVKLGSHFKKVKDYLDRFASIPDILELDHLTVTGDVYFEKNITLRGTVIIIANFGNLINMPTGAVLENKIVSGNMRILDH